MKMLVIASSSSLTKAFWYFWLTVGHMLFTCSPFQVLKLKCCFNNHHPLLLAMGRLVGLFFMFNKGGNVIRLVSFFEKKKKICFGSHK